MKIPLLLFADWSELISFAVGLVFLLVWLVNQVSDAKKKRAAGQMPAQPKPRPVAEPMVEEAPADADPLRKQIDEFLRRANPQAQAADQAKAGQGARRRPVRDEVVVLLDEAPPESRRGTSAPALQPAASANQPARRPRRQKQAKGPRGQSVSEHVAQRIGASKEEFNQEVADLGERVIQADKQFDTQLQQKFDHRLGSLTVSSTATAYDQKVVADTPAPAAQIAALLASPEGVRQAIILNEILRRPEDRW